MWDRLLGCGVVALSLGYLFATHDMPVKEIGDPIGPRMFPYLIGGAMLISGIWILLEAFLKKPEVEDTESHNYVKPRPFAVAGVIAWATLYFFLFERLGFAISCSIFLIGMMSFFNRGKHLTNISISVIFSFTVYFVFTQLLDVKLAPGIMPY